MIFFQKEINNSYYENYINSFCNNADLLNGWIELNLPSTKLSKATLWMNTMSKGGLLSSSWHDPVSGYKRLSLNV